jgi:hypothetical protein
MCFSATASFVAAGVLVPAGVYCLKKSNELDRRYWALAMLPLLFGVQQFIEGGVWLALEGGEISAARGLSYGFLFFSHFLWLAWVPYSSYLTEDAPDRKRLFLMITGVGVVLGAYMYLPLLVMPDWVNVAIVKHSIDYDLVFVFDDLISQQQLTAIYGLVIFLPLLLSSDRYHRILGGMVFVAALVTWSLFDWVFISVWCYFAGLISSYIFFMIAHRVQVERLPRAAG